MTTTTDPLHAAVDAAHTAMMQAALGLAIATANAAKYGTSNADALANYLAADAKYDALFSQWVATLEPPTA